MSERTLHPRPAAGSSAPLALLLVLPGCLTAELWTGYRWPDPVVYEEPVGARDRAVDGELLAPERVLEDGLWWRSADGEDRWLGPAAGAEVAAALLADPDCCRAERAVVDAERRYVDDEVVDDDAQLELVLRLEPTAFAQIVPPAELSARTARALLESRRNAFVLGVAPDVELPEPLASCARRLGGVDFGWILGESGPLRAAGWVFESPEGELLRCEVGAHEPLAARIAALAKWSLLVRVPHAGGATVLRMRADRAWLLAGLERAGDRFTQRSGWRLQRAPARGAHSPGPGAARVPARLCIREQQLRRWSRPARFDGDLLLRVAATPFALALDLAFGPPLGRFLRWLGGRDSGGGEAERRRDR